MFGTKMLIPVKIVVYYKTFPLRGMSISQTKILASGSISPPNGSSILPSKKINTRNYFAGYSGNDKVY